MEAGGEANPPGRWDHEILEGDDDIMFDAALAYHGDVESITEIETSLNHPDNFTNSVFFAVRYCTEFGHRRNANEGQSE